MSERLVVINATDLLCRGFATTPPDRRAPDGRPTNGLYATARGVARALSFKEPDVAVAVLHSNLATEDPALADQHEQLAGLLEGLGFRCVVSDQPESLVASYTRAARAAGTSVVVAGSDKRLAQLVSDDVWWYDAYKQVRYTAGSVKKRFGVAPEHVADWLALVGDDTAMEGVKGIGAKGAVQLLEQVGSLQAALDDPEGVEGRVGKALRKVLDDAERQRALAWLNGDLPLPVPLAELTYELPRPAKLNEVYARLGFWALLVAERPPLPCRVLDDLPDLPVDVGPAALWAVTEGPSPVRGELVGIALSLGDERLYFPRLGPRLVAWLEDSEQAKIGHDLKAAQVALAGHGVTLRGVVGDSILASHLADPSGGAPHEIDQITRVYLRRPLAEDVALLGTGNSAKRWSELSDARVGAHACQRAEAAADLWAWFSPRLDETGRRLLEEHLALSDTLVRMELAGMPCDSENLAQSGEDFTKIAEQLEQEIFELAGHAFNLNSTKQLGDVLYNELGLTVYSRTKTGWSTASHVLDRLVDEHPIVPLVIRHRQLVRLRSNWVESLRAAIGPDGRVHSTFHPARSFSGRIINSEPDLGRVPGKTPEMARIRQAFAARDGWLMLSIDYQQLGLYVLAHLTKDPALVEPLRRGDDMHVATASAVLDCEPEEVDELRRQIGKVVNFATFAGQGSSALRQQLRISVEESKAMIERFNRRYAVVRQFQDEQLAHAKKHGWVETIAGRRWRIGHIHSGDTHMRAYGERMARRAPHEGSVSDITRRGLLRADQALRREGLAAIPLLQVLDEVLFEVPEDELEQAAAVAADAMRNAFEMEVPLRVGAKAGRNWAELNRELET